MTDPFQRYTDNVRAIVNGPEQAQIERDAARYRGLRDALVNQDESFFERMEAACPSLRDEVMMPTKEEWDAALDTVLGLA